YIKFKPVGRINSRIRKAKIQGYVATSEKIGNTDHWRWIGIVKFNDEIIYHSTKGNSSRSNLEYELRKAIHSHSCNNTGYKAFFLDDEGGCGGLNIPTEIADRF